MKLPLAINSKKLVNMDECKEMMGIEKEFGICLFVVNEKEVE